MTLVANATVAGPSGGTTGTVDTTGATILVAFVASVGTPVVSDSKGNTWTALTSVGSTDPDARIHYAADPLSADGCTRHPCD